MSLSSMLFYVEIFFIQVQSRLKLTLSQSL